MTLAVLGQGKQNLYDFCSHRYKHDSSSEVCVLIAAGMILTFILDHRAARENNDNNSNNNNNNNNEHVSRVPFHVKHGQLC